MTSPASLHPFPVLREVIDQPQQIGGPLCDLATARGIEAMSLALADVFNRTARVLGPKVVVVEREG
jgi:hypothetical protein